EQVELVAVLPQQDVDERIELRSHVSVQRPCVQHVRAVHVVGGRVGPHGEKRLGRRVQVIEQPRVGGGELDAGPPTQGRAAHQDELGAEQPGGGQARRVGYGGLTIER